MQNYNRVRWVDSSTGEVTPQTALIKRYNSHIIKLEQSGIAIKSKIKAYPTLDFNQTGYCATPLLDFKENIREKYFKG
ncbi:hypothetical protein [Sporosarcina sp. FSL K6-1508]|uniref:hypothetical protein n=1 Tax=Sporosarcina sp. FSL K6-1508 TaxID=2921553 RepID=UPI0030F87E23